MNPIPNEILCNLTEDIDDGVDQTTISLVTGGSNVITAGVIQPGYSGSINANLSGGFNISIEYVSRWSFVVSLVEIPIRNRAGNLPITDEVDQ